MSRVVKSSRTGSLSTPVGFALIVKAMFRILALKLEVLVLSGISGFLFIGFIQKFRGFYPFGFKQKALQSEENPTTNKAEGEKFSEMPRGNPTTMSREPIDW